MKLNHLAIIMDGNRRWARCHALSVLSGHDQGSKRLKEIIQNVSEYDIGYLTVFAFSCENWRRSEAEVRGLIEMMRLFLDENIDALIKDNIKLFIMGNREAFDESLQNKLTEAEARSAGCTGLHLTVALNYGGQQDIEQAAEKFAEERRENPTLDTHFSSYLQTAHLPVIDMLIRTGGDQRLSNFILWDMSYAELYFTPTFWPDFSADDLGKAVNAFYVRSRRFGGDDSGKRTVGSDADKMA